MKTLILLLRIPSLAALVLSLGLAASHSQVVTQTITLQPGWNAVYLEVTPTNKATTAAFAGLPVASVWARAERLSSVEFIQNASEAAFNNAAWLRWFPPARSESFLNNLFAVQANHAYLIKSTNATPVVWHLTGRPSLRPPAWVSDSYNLRGLPVDSNSPPTFVNFFRYSKAHYNSASGQLQKIYRLNGSGQWMPVAPTDATKSGEAYWIFTQGASDYLAPLTPSVELGDGLDYGASLTELTLHLVNQTTSPLNALVREINANAPSAVSYYQFATNVGGQWPSLSGTLVQTPSPGGETRLRLAVRRQDFSSNSYASIIEVRDGAGTRLLVPLAALREDSAAPASGSFARRRHGRGPRDWRGGACGFVGGGGNDHGGF